MNLQGLTEIACGKNISLILQRWAPLKTYYVSHPAQKDFKFFTTSPVPVLMSGQAFMVFGR